MQQIVTGDPEVDPGISEPRGVVEFLRSRDCWFDAPSHISFVFVERVESIIVNIGNTMCVDFTECAMHMHVVQSKFTKTTPQTFQMGGVGAVWAEQATVWTNFSI